MDLKESGIMAYYIVIVFYAIFIQNVIKANVVIGVHFIVCNIIYPLILENKIIIISFFVSYLYNICVNKQLLFNFGIEDYDKKWNTE